MYSQELEIFHPKSSSKALWLFPKVKSTVLHCCCLINKKLNPVTSLQYFLNIVHHDSAYLYDRLKVLMSPTKWGASTVLSVIAKHQWSEYYCSNYTTWRNEIQYALQKHVCKVINIQWIPWRNIYNLASKASWPSLIGMSHPPTKSMEHFKSRGTHFCSAYQLSIKELL